MSRPKRVRSISDEPDFTSFSPDGTKAMGSVVLHLDEWECIKNMDLNGLSHAQCASLMGLSRPSVSAIYAQARRKIADAIVNGKKLSISGGTCRLCTSFSDCGKLDINEKGEKVMRIAVTYDNGDVFQHFGHTEYFKIYDVEDGKVVKAEVVSTNGQGHGALATLLSSSAIDTLICGGIGMGAKNALSEVGITLLSGVSGNTDDAVAAYLDGTLVASADANCDHHDHHHDSSHGCGGNCHCHG